MAVPHCPFSIGAVSVLSSSISIVSSVTFARLDLAWPSPIHKRTRSSRAESARCSSSGGSSVYVDVTQLIARVSGMPAGITTSAVVDGGVLRATPINEAWSCQNVGESGYWAAEMGDGWLRPGQAVPTCEMEPAPPPAANPTARLKRIYDGVSWPPLSALAGGALIERDLPWPRNGDLTDSVLGGTMCRPALADDGVLRCLPYGNTADLVYGDPTCSGAPVAALSGANAPPFGRHTQSPSCSTVYAVGAQIPMPSSLYRAAGPGCSLCEAYTWHVDGLYAYAVSIAPASMFAPLAIDVR